MAVTTAFCTSAKVDLLFARHNFALSGGATFKAALIAATHTGTYGAASVDYQNITTNSDEAAVTGGTTPSGYTTGGETLTRVDPTSSGTTAYTDFADVTITITAAGGTPTLASDGMMIYNDTITTPNADAAISVHAFAGTPTASGIGATFTIQFPTADASNAILRLA